MNSSPQNLSVDHFIAIGIEERSQCYGRSFPNNDVFGSYQSLVSNIKGSAASARRPMGEMIHFVVLYTAQIWRSVVKNRKFVLKLTRIQ